MTLSAVMPSNKKMVEDKEAEKRVERKHRKKEKKRHKKEMKHNAKKRSIVLSADTGEEPTKKKRKNSDETDTTIGDSATKVDKKSAGITGDSVKIIDNTNSDLNGEQHDEDRKPPPVTYPVPGDKRIVQTSALDFANNSTAKDDNDPHNVTLLLFYQYVEPPWDSEMYHKVLQYMQQLGDSLHLTGRMRGAKEGLNCTLTSSHESILKYCAALREFHEGEFKDTEFKLTTDLPRPQAFPSLKVMPVTELVHYGLDGEKAPPIEYTGVHLQPAEYHEKLAQSDTVVIDVRNHYEAAIGRFSAPHSKWLDPKMRKSTEFPVWLDKESTKEELRGKNVLMYCTGGVRCERASALLKYKMEKDPEIKELGIQGVYQLQGGIDKYFKEFPDGGYWEGKNYTFDKRFAHAPPQKELAPKEEKQKAVMGRCEACGKPWDMYRGKRRCPTCGVPSLICKDCFQADKDGIRKLDRNIRCDLCVEENITSKAQVRQRDEQDLKEYEAKMAAKGIPIERENKPKQPKWHPPAPNPDGVTRLLLKNMCRKNMDEATLMDAILGITHIVWKTDRKTGQFFGSGWVEMATPEDAARAVGMSGKRVLGRPLYISYQPPDGKDAWPPLSSKVV